MVDEAAKAKETIISGAREISASIHRGFAPSHDFSHVERVYRLAERIAGAEGADLFIVHMARIIEEIEKEVNGEQ